MSELTKIEKLKHKLGELTNPWLGSIRRSGLNNTDFTIISNNCWGGVCYEYYGLPKQSPTVGMYFFAEEYINFLSDIHGYIDKEFCITTAKDSKYKTELEKRGQSEALIGKLGDVEITLLHYHDKKIAEEKWKRRVERINWNNLIIKFSYMNLCSVQHIETFEKIVTDLKVSRKNNERIRSVLFVPWKETNLENAYYVSPAKDGQIDNDTFYWNRYCDVKKIINS